MTTVRTCRNPCVKKLANGTVKTYYSTRTYTTKRVYLRPEDLVAVGEMLAMGVPKSKIAAKFGISTHRLNKYINNGVGPAVGDTMNGEAPLRE